jgi:hypothetical protein
MTDSINEQTLRLIGSEVKTRHYTMESLILAQDER